MKKTDYDVKISVSIIIGFLCRDIKRLLFIINLKFYNFNYTGVFY